jgi:glycerophosphoryl diester phosphodiesterase
MKKVKQRVITHRALEPFNKDYFWGESTYEGFADQLSRGFGGLEFDPNPTRDGIVVWHDGTLERATGGKDMRAFADITMEELVSVPIVGRGRIATFQELLDLIRESDSIINALHLKSRLQTDEMLERIIKVLDNNRQVFDKLIVFDVKRGTAEKLKGKFPDLRLVPSVAHPYDIKRYNEAVGGTLLSLEDALELRKKGLIDGVWGDEWDRADEDGGNKLLYTKDFFEKVHAAGMFAALVTPELHGTSPHLLGGESHADAKDGDILIRRIKEIIEAGADYFCTDHPEEVAELLSDSKR